MNKILEYLNGFEDVLFGWNLNVMIIESKSIDTVKWAYKKEDFIITERDNTFKSRFRFWLNKDDTIRFASLNFKDNINRLYFESGDYLPHQWERELKYDFYKGLYKVIESRIALPGYYGGDNDLTRMPDLLEIIYGNPKK